MSTLDMNDLRQGVALSLGGQPYLVVWSDFMRTAQRKPVMRTKLKNLIDGKVLEQTFKPGDKIEEADLRRSKANFLYRDESGLHFMDTETYDQFSFTREQLGEKVQFLTDGATVEVLHFQEAPVAIDLPKKMELKVTETAEGIRGDTAQGSVMKEAVLEGGSMIKVPLFIKQGDTIRVNTETGDYVERV